MIVADKARTSGVMRSPFLFPPGKGLPAAAYNNIRGHIFDTIGLWSDAIEPGQRSSSARPRRWHRRRRGAARPRVSAGEAYGNALPLFAICMAERARALPANDSETQLCRKSPTRRLNASAFSHWAQCPHLANTTRSAFGICF